ncbi:MAG: dihydrofolate reductase family protein [Bacteroidota bacterium]
MKLKQSVFIATSLDGFIARPNGSLDWLNESSDGSSDPAEDFGYQAFMEDIDALVMGRNTFDKVLSFGEWPYGSTRVYVASHRELEDANALPEQVQRVAGSPPQIVEQLAEKDAHHLYIDGGQTIQQFLRSGLIQQITITRVPVLIGEGISLFGSLEQDLTLNHLSTRTFENGFVQSQYEVIHPE